MNIEFGGIHENVAAFEKAEYLYNEGKRYSAIRMLVLLEQHIDSIQDAKSSFHLQNKIENKLASYANEINL